MCRVYGRIEDLILVIFLGLLIKCQFCHKGLKSNYIQLVIKRPSRTWACIVSLVIFTIRLTLKKQYTVIQNQYTNLTRPLFSIGNQIITTSMLTMLNIRHLEEKSRENLHGPGRVFLKRGCNPRI